MKKISLTQNIICGLIMSTILSCSKDEVLINPVKNIDNRVISYVDQYYTAANVRGLNLDDRIVIDFGPLGEPSPNHYNYADYTLSGQKAITLNSQIFFDLDEQKQEAVVFFYLGRVVQSRPMVVFTYSFMNPDLFVHGYDPADREALLDELFQY